MRTPVSGRGRAEYGVAIGSVNGVEYAYSIEWEPKDNLLFEPDWQSYLGKELPVAIRPSVPKKFVCSHSVGVIAARIHADIGWHYAWAIAHATMGMLVGACTLRWVIKSLTRNA
jgi:hypothetical protein